MQYTNSKTTRIDVHLAYTIKRDTNVPYRPRAGERIVLGKTEKVVTLANVPSKVKTEQDFRDYYTSTNSTTTPVVLPEVPEYRNIKYQHRNGGKVHNFKQQCNDGCIIMNPYTLYARKARLSHVAENYVIEELRKEVTPSGQFDRQGPRMTIDYYQQYQVIRTGSSTPILTGQTFERATEVYHPVESITEVTYHPHYLGNPIVEWDSAAEGDNIAVDVLRNHVATELAAKVANAEFPIATNLGETAEGLRQLRLLQEALPALKKYRKLLNKIPQQLTRRKAFEAAKKSGAYSKAVLDTASSAWLTYRLFIQPTLGMVNDLHKAYWAPKVIFKTERTGAEQKQTLTGRASLMDGRISYSVENVITVKVTGVGKIKFSTLGDSTAFSFNAPLAAWELTPYSFVVDRFINVGNYIAAKVKTRRFLDSKSCVTTKHIQQSTGRLTLVEESRVTEGVLPDGRKTRTLSKLILPRDIVYKDEDVYLNRQVEPAFRLSINPNTLTLNQHVDHISLLWSQISSYLSKRNRK